MGKKTYLASEEKVCADISPWITMRWERVGSKLSEFSLWRRGDGLGAAWSEGNTNGDGGPAAIKAAAGKLRSC